VGKVHDLADFVYFDHSAHVNRGVGCVSCHGRVDKMEQVYQAESLAMSWCLNAIAIRNRICVRWTG